MEWLLNIELERCGKMHSWLNLRHYPRICLEQNYILLLDCKFTFTLLLIVKAITLFRGLNIPPPTHTHTEYQNDIKCILTYLCYKEKCHVKGTNVHIIRVIVLRWYFCAEFFISLHLAALICYCWITGVWMCDCMGAPWLGKQTDALSRVDGACPVAITVTGVPCAEGGGRATAQS